MARKRIGSFSKECQIKFDELINILHKLGYDKYHSNLQMIDDEVQNKVLEYLTDPAASNKDNKEKEEQISEEKSLEKEDKQEVKDSNKFIDIDELEDDIEENIHIKGREVKFEKKGIKKENLNDINLKKLKKIKENKFKETPRIEKIKVTPGISIKDFAELIQVRETEIIKILFIKGIMATINRPLEKELIESLSKELGIEIEIEEPTDILVEPVKKEINVENQANLVRRPPIVTIMGHVDHGKTSLLDVIRKTNVTEEEVGGITQKIGAYLVELNNKPIVFLDTPGHEAFTAMRARGATVTDIVVLVVAADDGVMPQTKEAISHAKAAKVPIIVAINKIDKPEANIERVKQQLAENDLLIEEWGGDIIAVPVSAKKKTGINELLEMILLVSDLDESLKADPNQDARGVIIESRLDKGKGPVATVIVQNGTLKIGDYFIAGDIDKGKNIVCGKVKNLINDKGKPVNSAGPSMPVEVMGFETVPRAGDHFKVIGEKEAKSLLKQGIVSSECPMPKVTSLEQGEFTILLKADFQGSLEALQKAISEIEVEGKKANIIYAGVGDISEADVLLASADKALIIGFNVKIDNNAKKVASTEHVDIRLYNIIFNLTQDIEKALKGLLEPQYEEVILGKAIIRAIFKIGKTDVVAGCYVQEGKITKNSKIRIYRNEQVIYDGKLSSLKRFKDDVKEVTLGYECGMSFENFKEFAENDIVEAYILEEKKEIF